MATTSAPVFWNLVSRSLFVYSNTTLLELQTLLFLFFSKLCASKLGVRLIYGCGLYTDVYGSLLHYFTCTIYNPCSDMYNIPVFKYDIGPVVSQIPQGLHRYSSNHHWNNTPEYDESLLYTILVQSFSAVFINIILSYQCQGGSSEQHLRGLLPALPSQLFHYREAFYSFITFKLLLQYVCTHKL